jgi:hypothetical protein
MEKGFWETALYCLTIYDTTTCESEPNLLLSGRSLNISYELLNIYRKYNKGANSTKIKHFSCDAVNNLTKITQNSKELGRFGVPFIHCEYKKQPVLSS